MQPLRSPMKGASRKKAERLSEGLSALSREIVFCIEWKAHGRLGIDVAGPEEADRSACNEGDVREVCQTGYEVHMKAHSQGLPKVCAAECTKGFSAKGKGGLSNGFPSGDMVSWMEGKGSLFESWVSSTEAWLEAMVRTGFGRSGEGATGPDSGTAKRCRGGLFLLEGTSVGRGLFGAEGRGEECEWRGRRGGVCCLFSL